MIVEGGIYEGIGMPTGKFVKVLYHCPIKQEVIFHQCDATGNPISPIKHSGFAENFLHLYRMVNF